MTTYRQTDFLSSPLYGLSALFEELATQQVSESEVLARASLTDSKGELSYHERIALFRASQSLATKPETALLAGVRQKISHFGAYGYALASSKTMRDTFRVGRDFFDLAGSVLLISLRIENGVGIGQSHHPESLGRLLPFVAEFWRSSQTRLYSLVLGRPFPSLHMSFPYPAPPYANLYSEILGCHVEFNSDVMEWRFDATVLDETCLHADANTAAVCEHYCEQFIEHSDCESSFQRELLRACIDNLSTQINAPRIARSLNMSVRTFYRRLRCEGISFQSMVDRVLRSVALEYLNNTKLSVDEIAHRCGYRDTSNFRKAFKRWTGRTPSSYRVSTKQGGPQRTDQPRLLS